MGCLLADYFILLLVVVIRLLDADKDFNSLHIANTVFVNLFIWFLVFVSSLYYKF